MPTYQTRMLVAQTDLSLGPDTVRKGDVFSATEADAEYLVRQKKAVEHGEVALPSEPVVTVPQVKAAAKALEANEAPEPASAAAVSATATAIEATLSDEYPAPSELAVEPSGTSRTDLLELAAAVGLKVDGRWSDKRLADEIEFVTKA